MSYERVGIAGLIPVGFQSSSLANSTAVGLDSTNTPSTMFDVSVETNDARYRADGTDPTLSTGVVLPKDNVYRFWGYGNKTALKFQRTTGTCLIQIQSYSHPGDATT